MLDEVLLEPGIFRLLSHVQLKVDIGVPPQVSVFLVPPRSFPSANHLFALAYGNHWGAASRFKGKKTAKIKLVYIPHGGLFDMYVFTAALAKNRK